MAAVAPADDDTVPIEPGTVSKALKSMLVRRGLEELVGLLCFMKVRTREALDVLGDRHFRQICSIAQAAQTNPGILTELQKLRRELAKQAMAADDVVSASERGDAVERALLTICAEKARLRAVEVLHRYNAARGQLTEAHRKLHEFTSRNVKDPVAGAKAAAGAYDEVRKALRDCPQEEEEFVRDAAVPVRDAVVLSTLSLCGYRDRDAFEAALQDAFGRQLDDEKLESQLHSSYSHLMEGVPGAFTSRSKIKIRVRRARQRGGRAAEAEPEQAGGEASDTSSTRASSSSAPSTVSIAAAITAPALLSTVPPFQPAYINPVLTSGFGAEDRNGGYGSAPKDWSHADCYGYQDFRSGPFVLAQEDFAQVEPTQAAKDPLNGVMIRKLFGDRWYGAQVMSIHEKLSTRDWWYLVRYQDGETEILQDFVVQQGVQDLQGPPPPHADPGMLQERYAKNAGFSKASKMQSDVESENTDDDGLFLDGIEEEPSEHTSKLQEYLAAALKEVSRLRLGLEPLAVAEGAASEPELTLGSDGNGQEEQLFYDRLGVLAETLNTELVSLKPFQTYLWLGTV